MIPLTHVGITAQVRTQGSSQPYQPRTFDLMLCPTDPQDRQLKEATRILRQLGYQARKVEFEPPPGN